MPGNGCWAETTHGYVLLIQVAKHAVLLLRVLAKALNILLGLLNLLSSSFLFLKDRLCMLLHINRHPLQTFKARFVTFYALIVDLFNSLHISLKHLSANPDPDAARATLVL